MAITLRSDRLTVEIAEPGVFPNTTTRFDRAGFITEVTLDGRDTFCQSEPETLSHVCSGGRGLCSEFLMEAPSVEAKIGEQFPKLGIGLLTRHGEEPYVFFHRYDCMPFPVRVSQKSADCVEFVTEPVNCMGYGARQRRAVSVRGNTLTMAITVENCGEKTLEFSEYCHNFLSLEHRNIGPDYVLKMPLCSQIGKEPVMGCALEGREDGFGFSGFSHHASMMTFPQEEILGQAPFCWELSHRESPLTVTEEISVKPCRGVIWAVDQIISPEIMCGFSILPGKSETWTRTWTFERK